MDNGTTTTPSNGFWHLSEHARERLAERFAVTDELEAERWLVAEMADTHIMKVSTKRGWMPVGYRKLYWFTRDAMIVTEGNVVVTVTRRGGDGVDGVHDGGEEGEVA